MYRLCYSRSYRNFTSILFIYSAYSRFNSRGLTKFLERLIASLDNSCTCCCSLLLISYSLLFYCFTISLASWYSFNWMDSYPTLFFYLNKYYYRSFTFWVRPYMCIYCLLANFWRLFAEELISLSYDIFVFIYESTSVLLRSSYSFSVFKACSYS